MCSREWTFQRSKLCQFTGTRAMAGLFSIQLYDINFFPVIYYVYYLLVLLLFIIYYDVDLRAQYCNVNVFTPSFSPSSLYINCKGSISLQTLVIKSHLMRMGMHYQSMMWWTGGGSQMEAQRLTMWERSKNWLQKSLTLSLMKTKSFGILNQKRSAFKLLIAIDMFHTS